MPETVAIIGIMGVPTAFTGLCFWFIERKAVKREEKREEKEKAREESEFLLMKSIGASIALGEATAHAIINGKSNGEMTAALKHAQDVKHEQKDFMTKQGIKYLY